MSDDVTTVAEAPSAWDTEDSDVVIYGTHGVRDARAAYQKYLAECGFKISDDEYSPEADSLAFYEGMRKLWTEPKDEEEPFDHFTEPGDGRVPWMYGSLS
jgi:hypothetical protein